MSINAFDPDDEIRFGKEPTGESPKSLQKVEYSKSDSLSYQASGGGEEKRREKSDSRKKSSASSSRRQMVDQEQDVGDVEDAMLESERERERERSKGSRKTSSRRPDSASRRREGDLRK